MDQQCGTIAIVGRANVGKSTLLNELVGQKLASTCHKAQTTRCNLLGIRTQGAAQFLFLDTPGLQPRTENLLTRSMNQSVQTSVRSADVILLVVEALRWLEVENSLLTSVLGQRESKKLLVVNKIDKVHPKEKLLAYLKSLPNVSDFDEVCLVSAYNSKEVNDLLSCISKYLPLGPHAYKSDELTDRSQSFLAAEAIREQILRRIHAEIPYASTVGIDKFVTVSPRQLDIWATIYVEREGQKKILIGTKGENLKAIGMAARKALSELFGLKLNLQLWVKCKKEWSQNPSWINRLGSEYS